MKDSEKYSCTSNIAKLLKHLPKLQNIQDGYVSPIMVHVIPTHRCQLNCVHCCFKNRKGLTDDMPYEMFVEAMWQFDNLGVKSIEYTGGGEPTLWPYINQAIARCRKMGIRMGMITNGLEVGKIMNPEHLDWVRVSLNTLDYTENLNLGNLANKTRVTFCYIWNENADENIDRVIKFANEHEIVCRVAPDCIQPLNDIADEISYIRGVLRQRRAFNKFTFLSDFNIDLYRTSNDCRIHMIKPCLYLDGWVYACPSAELAVENEKQIQPGVRVCKYTDIVSFYRSKKAREPFQFDCSYCKYVKQQEILEALCMETEFNEFA